MKIEVRSRNNAKIFKCDVPWAAISITSEPNHWPNLPEENRVDLLRLFFLDVTWGDYSITEAHAQEILKFVTENIGKIECLLVHCDAGLSRSPAVAAAISRIFMGEGADQPYFDKYFPNYLVYKTILQAHFGTDVAIREPWDSWKVEEEVELEIIEDKVFGEQNLLKEVFYTIPTVEEKLLREELFNKLDEVDATLKQADEMIADAETS